MSVRQAAEDQGAHGTQHQSHRQALQHYHVSLSLSLSLSLSQWDRAAEQNAYPGNV